MDSHRLPAETMSADAHYNLGVASAGQGDHHKAIAAFEQALDANPLHAAAQRNLGEALRRIGDFPRAVLSLQEAIRLAAVGI